MNELPVLVSESSDVVRSREIVQSFLGRYPEGNSRTAFRARLLTLARLILRTEAVPYSRGVDVETLLCSVPWHLLREPHTQALRARLIEQFAPATVNLSIVALRRVLRAAWRVGAMPLEEYTRAVEDLRPVPKQGVRAKMVVSPVVLAELVQRLPPRDLAIFGLLYGCGMRRSEVAQLPLENYERSDGRVRVIGKGGKERVVFAPEWAWSSLSAWADAPARGSSPFFFPLASSQGQRSVGPRELNRIVQGWGVAFKPHDLRRTYITRLLKEGVDLLSVQRLVGHSRPETTSVYDQRGEEEARESVTRLPDPRKTTSSSST